MCWTIGYRRTSGPNTPPSSARALAKGAEEPTLGHAWVKVWTYADPRQTGRSCTAAGPLPIHDYEAFDRLTQWNSF